MLSDTDIGKIYIYYLDVLNCLGVFKIQNYKNDEMCKKINNILNNLNTDFEKLIRSLDLKIKIPSEKSVVVKNHTIDSCDQIISRLVNVLVAIPSDFLNQSARSYISSMILNLQTF